MLGEIQVEAGRKLLDLLSQPMTARSLEAESRDLAEGQPEIIALFVAQQAKWRG